MELGTIFNREQYSIAYKFAEANNYNIRQIGNDNYIIEEKKMVEFSEPTYKELRQSEYPPIEEQLDMLYWDKINDTDTWQETITEIKNKYPKPTEELEEQLVEEDTLEEDAEM